jgi:hypothetical protein
MAGKSIRRVVTGTNADGRAVIASDTVLEADGVAMMPGAGFVSLWGDDQPPTLPTAGDRPGYNTWFPPPGGYRVEQITIPPSSTPAPAGLDMAAAAAEMEKKLPGLLGHMNSIIRACTTPTPSTSSMWSRDAACWTWTAAPRPN